MAGRSTLSTSLEIVDGSGVGLPCGSGGVEGRLEVGELLAPGRLPGLVVGQVVGELVALVGELLPPGRKPVGGSWLCGWCGMRAVGLGEVAALGDGGKVGSVVSQDAVEDVPSFGRVVGVGDDVDAVVVASAGGGDVQPTVGGGRRGEGDTDVDGVALVAVLGGGVAEPDMLSDIVGGQGHVAASVEPFDREGSVEVGRDNEPLVAVADGLAAAGGEVPVVAAGHDDLTDIGLLLAGDGDGGGWVEIAGVKAGALDGVVECVDVLVAAGRDRHRPPGGGEREPVSGDAGQVILEPPGADATVGLVDIDGVGVSGAQLQRRGRFPGVGEAVDADQLVGAAGGGQLGEQPAPPDRLQLSGVADQHEPPVEMLGPLREVVQGAGPQHPALVDDQGAAGGKHVAAVGKPIPPGPFVEQLGHGVGVHARLGTQDVSRLGRRGDTEHSATVAAEIVHRGPQHGRLARPGRPDHDHQPIRPGHRGGGVTLEDVEPVTVDGGRWGRVGELGVEGPSQDPFLLSQDGGRRVVRSGGFQPHRPTVRGPARGGAVGVEVHALPEHLAGNAVQGRRPLRAGEPWDRWGQVAYRPHDVGPRPGGPDGGELIEDLGDGHRCVGLVLVCWDGETVGETLGRPAELPGFVPPPLPQVRDGLAGLARPGVGGGLAGHGGPFPAGRVPAFPGSELFDGVGQCCVDLRRAFRERLQQLGWDAGDLGLAVDDRPPRDAVAVGELGPQHRLIQAAQRPLVPLQEPGIQGPPPPIDGLDLARDHSMGVDLRVVSPGGDLTERRHRQPDSVGMQPATVRADPSGGPVPLQVAQRRADGDVVSVEQAGVAGERPPHAQRLRCRERGIEPRHRPHHPPIGRPPIDQRRSQPRAVARVATLEQQLQIVGLDPTVETEPVGLPADPVAWFLAGGASQVAGVVGSGSHRRRRVEGGDPQHQPAQPDRGTCL
jgi:hypothetical protein